MSNPAEDRKDKKTVALVGFASDSRNLAPYDDLNVDIWSLNKAHQEAWLKRFDMYFQLHSPEYLKKSIGLSKADREHWKWLHEPHDFMIFMQHKYDDMPASVEFPIEDARMLFGNFYTSSLAFMMALAIMEGYERIELYGFNLSADSEYYYQRDSGEYFIGLAEGMGIEVYLPPVCPMVKGRLYGFEGAEIGLRQIYEFRVRELTKNFNNHKARFQVREGFLAKMTELAQRFADLDDMVQAGKDSYNQVNNDMQATFGAKNEALLAIELFDKYFNNGGTGEIDKHKLLEFLQTEAENGTT